MPYTWRHEIVQRRSKSQKRGLTTNEIRVQGAGRAAVVDLAITVADLFNDGITPGLIPSVLFSGDSNVKAVRDGASSSSRIRWSVAGFDEVNFSVNPFDGSDWVGTFASATNQQAYLSGEIAGLQAKVNYALQSVDAENGDVGVARDTALNLSSLHDPATLSAFSAPEWFPNIDGGLGNGTTVNLTLNDTGFVRMHQIATDADNLPFTRNDVPVLFGDVANTGFHFRPRFANPDLRCPHPVRCRVADRGPGRSGIPSSQRLNATTALPQRTLA